MCDIVANQQMWKYCECVFVNVFLCVGEEKECVCARMCVFPRLIKEKGLKLFQPSVW